MKAEDVTSEAERGNIKNWFSNALSTRLNDKRDGAIVSIQQRLHEDDLPAYLADKGYTCLNLPAVAEEDQLFAIGREQTYLRKAGVLLDPVRFTQLLELQMHRWQEFHKRYTPEGRLVDHIRGDRPPLPKLPAWIEGEEEEEGER